LLTTFEIYIYMKYVTCHYNKNIYITLEADKRNWDSKQVTQRS